MYYDLRLNLSLAYGHLHKPTSFSTPSPLITSLNDLVVNNRIALLLLPLNPRHTIPTPLLMRLIPFPIIAITKTQTSLS